MTTITAADLATVRRRSGDNPQPYDLQDADIDAIYTSTSLGNLDLNRTTFFVLRERLGLATNDIAISNPMGGLSRNQKFDQIMKMLTYWGIITGLDFNNLGEGGFAEWSLNNGNYS